MTACLLYGLSVVRLLQAMQSGAAQRKRHEGKALPMLALLPLCGVLASVVLIAMLSTAPVSDAALASSYVNLVLAVLCFAVLGGYGIRGDAPERSGKPP